MKLRNHQKELMIWTKNKNKLKETKIKLEKNRDHNQNTTSGLKS